MRKRIVRLIALLTIVGVLVQMNGGFSRIFRSPSAQAVGDLSVDWGLGLSEGDPIFVVNSFAPGDSESRTVTVFNDATLTRPVAVRGILTSETSGLSSALHIIILHGATEVYGGTSPTGPKTLQQFFVDSSGPDGIYLSDLAASDSTQYTFIVSFDTQAGNEYQNASVVFDLKIGIAVPAPAECNILNLTGDLIYGTQKKDILQGTPGNDLIFALEGDDIVQGRGGDDCIVGGLGKDNLHGEAGNDVILGQEGDDVLLGFIGNDRLYGGIGKDDLHGHDGEDILSGGVGDDSMHGTNGNDTLNGGDGRDAMYGENGNDTMLGEAGNDSMHGGNNNDTINGGTGANNIFGGGGTDTCSNGIKFQCEM